MAAPLAKAVRPSRAGTPRASASRLKRNQRGAAALFIVPFFVLFAVVMAAPIIYAVWMSLFQERASSGLGFGGTERAFAGFGNFTNALSDQGFRESFLHIAVYCALYIPVMIGAALGLALLRGLRGRQGQAVLPARALPAARRAGSDRLDPVDLPLHARPQPGRSTGSAPSAVRGTSSATTMCSRRW